MRVCVALSKLVDNAVKYARAGEVAITARSPVLGSACRPKSPSASLSYTAATCRPAPRRQV